MFRYPDPTPILSQLYTYSVFKTPIFGSDIYTGISGRESRIQTQIFPVWEFKLKFEALRTQTQNIIPYTQWSPNTDYEKILAVFLACKGRYGRFFFQDPSDCSRTGQIAGRGTGSATTFRIVRTSGASGFTFNEFISGIDISQLITVYVDGIPVVGWNISSDYQNLVFSVAPADGTQITMDFYFFYLCRFLEDMSDFEEFMANLHQNGEFGFVSIKNTLGPQT